MTTCTRCGRALTSARSITTGIGPTCARKVRETAAAAAELVKPGLLAKALEDIEDGALINTRRVTSTGRPIWAVVSSYGDATYLTVPGGACTCLAGHRGLTCRHSVAAALLTVA